MVGSDNATADAKGVKAGAEGAASLALARAREALARELLESIVRGGPDAASGVTRARGGLGGRCSELAESDDPIEGLPELPADAYAAIAAQLEARDAARCTCVCRRWRRLASADALWRQWSAEAWPGDSLAARAAPPGESWRRNATRRALAAIESKVNEATAPLATGPLTLKLNIDQPSARMCASTGESDGDAAPHAAWKGYYERRTRRTRAGGNGVFLVREGAHVFKVDDGRIVGEVTWSAALGAKATEAFGSGSGTSGGGGACASPLDWLLGDSGRCELSRGVEYMLQAKELTVRKIASGRA